MVFWNRTKIIATVGPASNSKTELRAMLSAGADLFRINGAHGSAEEHRKTIVAIRAAAKAENFQPGILFDLPGPKLRLGDLKEESMILKKNQLVVLACGKKVQKDDALPLQDKFICKALHPGSKVFINDGIVELRVTDVSGIHVHCKVIAGGEIRSRKGVNLPNVKLPIPSLTKKDKELLKFAIKEKVDYVGLSFVRTVKNIKDLRKLLNKDAPEISIVAKIEKPEALDVLDQLIEVADAIMIARGDLGIEMPFEQIPVIQRKILRRCLAAGKPAITATQMLESMVEDSRPTRAEATDVAGAVWGGTDAIMLSEETSIGKHPTKAVRAMAKIAESAEGQMSKLPAPERKKNKHCLQAQMISLAASLLASELDASAFVTPTRTGRTALYTSRMRPRAQIIAPTEHDYIARRMSLFWGVKPMLMGGYHNVDEMLDHAEKAAIKSRLIKKGDRIIITSGAHGHKDDISRLVEVREI